MKKKKPFGGWFGQTIGSNNLKNVRICLFLKYVYMLKFEACASNGGLDNLLVDGQQAIGVDAR